MEPIEIAAADDDMIAVEVLKWSGCLELWNEHELDEDYNFTTDVLEMCDSAWVDAEEWDAGAPGRSGVWYVVTTEAPDELKAEIRARIDELIGEAEQGDRDLILAEREQSNMFSSWTSYVYAADDGDGAIRLWSTVEDSDDTETRQTVHDIRTPAGFMKALQDCGSMAEMDFDTADVREMLPMLRTIAGRLVEQLEA